MSWSGNSHSLLVSLGSGKVVVIDNRMVSSSILYKMTLPNNSLSNYIIMCTCLESHQICARWSLQGGVWSQLCGRGRFQVHHLVERRLCAGVGRAHSYRSMHRADKLSCDCRFPDLHLCLCGAHGEIAVWRWWREQQQLLGYAHSPSQFTTVIVNCGIRKNIHL